MASNYKYKSKNTIKSQFYNSSAGVGTCVYDISFNNNPITIASPNIPTGTGDAVIISTSIYSQTFDGFNTISYYKAATAGLLNGGLFNGKLNYFSLDNTAIQTYTFNNSSIIKAGSFTTTNGACAVSFTNPTFINIPHVVVSPTGLSSLIISCVVNNRTTTGFNALSLCKDGRNNEAGGGYYAGTFNYIAVDNVAISTYKSNTGPTIKSGIFNTDASGLCTISNLDFNTGSVSVYCSPIDNTDTKLITYNIRSVSTSSFSMSACYKDGNSGQNGGNVFDGSFNYIAVAF
jgi:hypothetical protein